ncbi:MAG: flagellar basal body rod protein FlgB [Alphaproteobacteria bacterium CG_4_10_14_0_8_um_filter_53_9]|nr:MAG: flagellar basal body rod protein FlgB [Alphaproteobacteria bacterium CG_4_10_14_0_8_um_filter_53_9]
MSSLYAALATRMDYLTARQGVLAGNIANADTPGYLSQDLVAPKSNSSFAKTLSQTRTNGMHMSAGQGSSTGIGSKVSSAAYMQHNGNAVRIDDELNKMNQTKIEYQMMTQLYSKQMAMQKLALGR